jgi:TPR repeat protein
LPEDRTEAARWLKKSASAEKAWKDLASKAVPDAQLRLGLIYWHGIGVPRDGGLALRHLEAAANGGSTLAAGWLCTVYMEGEIAPRNEAIALKWLEESARGSIEARAILGRSYLRGNLGVGKDYDKALALLEPAAKAGSLAAQTSLAEMYASGFGVVQNSSEAYRLFAEAAARGYAPAAVAAARMSYQGDGTGKDQQRALSFFKAAAEQGYAVAMVNLGMLYEQDGPLQSYSEALRWFRNATDAGSRMGYGTTRNARRTGAFRLGKMYNEGLGTTRNDREAAKWFKIGADEGLPEAQLYLGVMYTEGMGVPQDFTTAYMWLNLAGTTPALAVRAQKARDVLAKRMTPEQVAVGQELARNWKPSGSTGEQSTAELPNVLGLKLVASGSGFLINSLGHILTNNHVVEGCAEVRLADGQVTRVVASDSQNDLAVTESQQKPTAIATFRDVQAPRLGEAVFAVGYPLQGLLASSLSITPGAISALAGIRNDIRFLQVTSPVQPGNSGGPLLDDSGNVIGVISSKLDALKIAGITGDIPQNVNFAIKSSLAEAFLEANGIHYVVKPSNTRSEATAIAERARNFTVLLECWK